MKKNFLEVLRSRGLVSQVSHESELEGILSKVVANEQDKPVAVYLGIDPTAKSLTIGHLVPLLTLRRAQLCGLVPIVLFGGATGLVGDPTGRTEMRQMLSKETIDGYIQNFKKMVEPFFEFDVPNPPIFVNNIDWIGPMGWLEFGREVGVHFTVARLLAAEVNRTRLEQGGLTFMELGYQLLQAYDFLMLHRKYNCILQIGGNDQWSNVLAGADLIRRVDSGRGFALTVPLLVSSDGQKIGKSAGNAIWLDSSLTSAYDFFQYFRNVADSDLAMMYRWFTFYSLDEISQLLDPNHISINESKQLLAYEVTKFVHGQEAAEGARAAAKALFSGGGDFSQAPKTVLSELDLTEHSDVLWLLVKTKLATSRGEAKKLILGGGLTINHNKILDPMLKITGEFIKENDGVLLLKKGKKDFHIVEIN